MDFDHMYDDAISQERKAIKLVSLLILVLAVVFFFAGILLTEPVLGFSTQFIKNTLVITSVVIAIGGIMPLALSKKEKIEY